jgi:hypothetical protein
MYEQNFHRRWALFYANEAAMKRIDAVAFVEGPTDKAFWRHIFEHVGLRVNVITGSNKADRPCGKQECLKYFPFLSTRFIICIDSDYDNFRQLHPRHNPRHHVLQTYAYAIENHYLASHPGLRNFLRDYSRIIYQHFLRHLSEGDSVNEFCGKIAPQNGHRESLVALQQRLGEAPAPSPDSPNNPYHALGLSPDNTYLYIKAKVLKGRLQCGNRLSFEHYPMEKILKDIEDLGI